MPLRIETVNRSHNRRHFDCGNADLNHYLLNTARQHSDIGFFVDAKDSGAALYYRKFGFIPLPDNPLELFLPIDTIRNAFKPG